MHLGVHINNHGGGVTMTVTVYSTPNCVACRQTKRLLARQGTPYVEAHISEAPYTISELKELGYQTAPFVQVLDSTGGLIDEWAGFKPDRIKELAEH
nr:MAG TPA: glutaredoxin-like protein [Bacteriophage sp.]